MGTQHDGPIVSMFILIMLMSGVVETFAKTGNSIEIRIQIK